MKRVGTFDVCCLKRVATEEDSLRRTGQVLLLRVLGVYRRRLGDVGDTLVQHFPPRIPDKGDQEPEEEEVKGEERHSF